MDTIRPALTAEEWARWEYDEDEGVGRFRFHQQPGTDWQHVVRYAENSLAIYPNDDDHAEPHVDVEGVDSHALAALCLHGQTFGFTWRDVDELRFFSSTLMSKREAPETGGSSFAQWCDSLADRIEALLPPRQETP